MVLSSCKMNCLSRVIFGKQHGLCYRISVKSHLSGLSGPGDAEVVSFLLTLVPGLAPVIWNNARLSLVP